jgi:flagellar basal body-associated protein FliL
MLLLFSENRGTTLYLLVIIVPVVLVCVIAVLFYCCYWRRRNERRNNKRNKAGTDEVNAVSVALSPPARQNSIPSAPPANDVMLYDPQMVAPPTYEEAQFHSVAPSYY